jgi:GT2 family glycosyltransferase
MSYDVAIIIVSYNSAPCIEACLHSVFKQCAHLTHEVIVLDNNSSDTTVALVRERFPTVNLLIPGRNLGFAAGVNHAVRHADSNFLLLLNPDTVLLDGAIDTIVAFARLRPAHGLYGGRAFKPDGTLEPSSCWDVPTIRSLALFAFGLSTLASGSRWFDPESIGGWQRDTTREVGVITGCFLLVRRSLWQELGGFDERYFMYGEDIDLALRARAKGMRPIICPDARFIHEVGRSSASASAKILLLYRGKASVVRQHWRGLRRQTGIFLLATGVALRAFVSAAVSKFSHRRTAEQWRAVWRERHGWLKGYPAPSDRAPAISPT